MILDEKSLEEIRQNLNQTHPTYELSDVLGLLDTVEHWKAEAERLGLINEPEYVRHMREELDYRKAKAEAYERGLKSYPAMDHFGPKTLDNLMGGKP